MRSLIILVMLLACAPDASACDVCGCSIGGNYFGILPQFHKHFIGLRWSEQSFRSAHSLIAARNGDFDSEEHFRTIDLIGRFYPVRRVQVLALAPYHYFQRMENGIQTQSRGLGDISLLGNYILLDSGDSIRHQWRQTLMLGGGLKIPTGRSGLRDAEGETLLENLQPGTGSVDFVLSGTYTLRHKAWGLSTDAQGRLNTGNRHGYRFGNRISSSAKVFYVKNLKRATLLPNIGLFADVSDNSYNGRTYLSETGGTIALATLGLDVYLGQISLGYTWQSPVYQHLGDGKVQNRNRWMATLNYNF